MALSKITINKQPGETRLVSMDFSNKMATAEVIVSIDSVAQILADGGSTTDLTFSGQTINGQVAQFLVAGGTIPDRSDIQECDYKVTVTITTDYGQILENDGILKIKED
jgi:hypothetical protein